MRLVPKRLVNKLILSLTVIVVIVGVVSGYVSVKTQERQLLDAVIVGADQLSKGITGSTWQAMLANHREATYEVMQTIAEKQGINRIRIFNKDGRVMFSTRVEEKRQVGKDSEACSLCHLSTYPLDSVDVPSRARIMPGPGGRRKLTMITAIYNEPACSQASCHAHPASQKVLGVLDVAFDLDRVDREVAVVQLRVLLVTGVQVLLITLFVAFFVRYFVGIPTRKLIEGTRAVSAMQLDRPIRIDSSEELGELGCSFNMMREKLKQSMEENAQFTQDLETKVKRRTEQLEVAHQNLLQSDRLASLGQLSASVAHEINNPLSGVLNLSMLMQRILKDDGIPPDRVPEFREYLSQVVRETSRVGRIVSDLLAFSRRSKPQRGQVDLNAIVRSTLSLVSHKLKIGNIQVDLRLDENLPLVRCDSSQMQQVVLNLVMNAAEATHAKEERRVAVKTGVDAASRLAVLEVVDNGEGIPPENLQKVFNPFFTTKGEGKGVGLGLFVVYGIVDAHGGEIDVKSRVGEGTTMTVTLPLSAPEPAPAPQAADDGAAARERAV